MTLRSLTPEAVIELAAECGLEALEWGGDVHVPAGDLDGARAVAHRTRTAGLRCASYGSYLHAGHHDVAGTTATMATAAALGAPNVRVWTDWIGPAPAPSARQAVVDDLGAIAAAAADHGLTVSLEFHPGTLTETAASTVSLLADVGADNLFSYWQPPHDLDRPALLGSWLAMREASSHLHVFRWRTPEDRRPLEEGEDLWPSVFASQPTTGRWRGPRVAFLEFVRDDDPLQLRADAAVLCRWLEG